MIDRSIVCLPPSSKQRTKSDVGRAHSKQALKPNGGIITEIHYLKVQILNFQTFNVGWLVTIEVAVCQILLTQVKIEFRLITFV